MQGNLELCAVCGNVFGDHGHKNNYATCPVPVAGRTHPIFRSSYWFRGKPPTPTGAYWVQYNGLVPPLLRIATGEDPSFWKDVQRYSPVDTSPPNPPWTEEQKQKAMDAEQLRKEPSC